jgi:hypothetical protein
VQLKFQGEEAVSTSCSGCCSLATNLGFYFYCLLIFIGFIWAPENVLKYQEGFDASYEYFPSLDVTDYSGFPAVYIHSNDA